MMDPPSRPGPLVARLVDAGDLGRLGSSSMLKALLTLLGRTDHSDRPSAKKVRAGQDALASPADSVTRALLAGHGRFTRSEVAERAGIGLDEASRLWRALGFPEVDDSERAFTRADVLALTEVSALITSGIVDGAGLVDLARPMGNLMSRLAAAQTGFVSEVLGDRIAKGRTLGDPDLSSDLTADAATVTRELLPILERTTVYVWRRHLAAEVRRALLPNGPVTESPPEGRPSAVGFIDITGYTRLSRDIGLTDLARLLDRFETMVLETVVANGGRVIKNLGDEVLFVNDDAHAAAETTLQLLDDLTGDELLPGVHAGLAYGPVLYRGGDVFGPVVNIASRLAGVARHDTVRIDEAMASAIRDADQFMVTSRLPRPVRGYLQLRSYRLRRAPSR